MLFALLLLLAMPALAQTPATCDTLAASIAAAAPGDTIALAPGSRCGPMQSIYRNALRLSPALTITASFDKPVTVDLTGSTLFGVLVKGGGGVTFMAGSIVAAEGYGGFAGNGYAVQLVGAHDVAVIGTEITDAKKAFMIGGNSRNITIRGVYVHGQIGDGVIVTATDGLVVEWSRFADFVTVPQQCRLPDGSIIYGEGRAACDKLAGAWKDGDHQDGIQPYDGVKNATFRYNWVFGVPQGFNQLAGCNRPEGKARTAANCDANEDVAIDRNAGLVSGYWSFGVADCARCSVTNNLIGNLTQGRASPPRGYVDMGTVICGNVDTSRGGKIDRACP